MTDTSISEIHCPLCNGTKHTYISARKRWRCENIDCCEVFDAPPPKSDFIPQTIFLSYAHTVDGNNDHSAVLVRKIKAKLEQAGHKTWIDEQQLHPGFNWRQGITQGILNSDRVLSFLSPRSIRDPGVCLDEIGIAMAHKHGAIATVLTDERTAENIPASVSHIQYLNMAGWESLTANNDGEPWLDNKVRQILDILANNASFAGDLEFLAKRLNPSTSVAKIGRLIENGLVGRQWIFDAIEKWRLTEPSQRVFKLIGLPGTGKSAIAAHLAHFAKLRVVAYHFCEQSQPETRSPRAFVQNLAFMLAARLPAYRTLLRAQLDLLDSPLHEQSADYLMTQLIVDPLRSQIDGGQSDDRLLIVIDGLDEGDISITQLLGRQLPNLPTWLGVVVTGRPSVSAYLDEFPSFDLNIAAENNLNDLREFLSTWAQQNPALTSNTQQHLFECASGQILFLVMARRAVEEGRMDIADLPKLPPGLGGFYQNWFEQAFGHKPGENPVWNELVYPFLEILCASPMPLPVHIARNICDWHGQNASTIRTALSGLVVWNNAIEFSHKSITDWLYETSSAFCINFDDGNQRLTNWLYEQIPDSTMQYAYVDEHVDICRLMNSLAQIERQRKRIDVAKKLYEGVLTICFSAASIPPDLAGPAYHSFKEATNGLIGLVNDSCKEHDDLDFSCNNTRDDETLIELSVYGFSTFVTSTIPHIQGKNQNYPEGALSELFKLAINVDRLNLSQVADKMHEMVYRLREKYLGSDHADTICSQFLCERIDKSKKRELQGESQFKLKIERQIERRGMQEVDHTFSAIGLTLEKLFLFEEAKAAYELLFEVAGKSDASQSKCTACLTQMARMLFREKNYINAKKFYEQLLNIYTSPYSQNTDDEIRTLYQLAELDEAMQDYASARTRYDYILANRQSTLGAHDPKTLEAIAALAGIDEALGDFKAARSKYEYILDTRRECFGQEVTDPGNYFTAIALIRTLRSLGEHSLADQLETQTEIV